MRRVRQWIGLCCVWWLCCAMGNAWSSEEQIVVLVTSAHTTVPQLSPIEVRKLFLGIPVIKNGQRIEPLLNLSDPLLYEVFLQKVMFMSASGYERRLLSRTFQQGDAPPLEFSDLAALSDALRSRPGTVSFMWEQVIRARPGLRVVQELCRNPAE